MQFLKNRLVETGLLLISIFSSQNLFSNPQNPSVIFGAASFDAVSDTVYQVHTGDLAIISWEQFSIQQGELTRFLQSSAGSAVLNRVMGGNLSEIYGTLESNGKIYLINPSGVIVGPDAVINTGSFIGSTFDCLDEEFVARGDLNFQGESKAAIINYGKVHGWDGDVALISYQIDNEGELHAPNGTVSLAAGQNILLKPDGDFLIRASSVSNREGTGIENGGRIEALRTELKTNGNAYLHAINHKGSIDALQVAKVNGTVYLVAENGSAEISGSITALGGEIQILGDQVAIVENAVLDVSGPTGGGTILIGGDYQGKNPLISNAKITQVSQTVQLRADALISGDGGKIILWGNDATHFSGFASVEAGIQGGNGGLIEVSSPKYLEFQGRISARAPSGKMGLLYLDPPDVTISAAATTGGTFTTTCTGISPCAGGSFTPGATNPININNTDLANCLNCANVTIDTSTGTGSGANNGSISVLDNVLWSAPTSLTLLTPNNSTAFILVNASMVNSDGSSLPTTNIFDLFSQTVIVGDGTQISNAEIYAQSGSILITAPKAFSMSSQIAGGGGANVLAQGSSPNNGNITINATGGTIDMISPGNASSTIQSQDGNIQLTATGNMTLDGSGGAAGVVVECSNLGGLTAHSLTGDVIIKGGGGGATISSGSGDLMLLSDNGNILFEALSTGMPTQANIKSTSGAVTMTANNGTVTIGSITQTGYSTVLVNGSNPITVTANDINILGGALTGNIVSNIAGLGNTKDIIILNASNITLGNPLGNSQANLLVSSQSGNIRVNVANQLQVYGGTSLGMVSAISAIYNFDMTAGGGELNVTAGSILLQGGPSTMGNLQTYAELASSGGALTITLTKGGISLDGKSTAANLISGNALTIQRSMSATGVSDIIWKGGSLPSAFAGSCVSGGDLTIDLNGKIDVTGGSGSGSFMFMMLPLSGVNPNVTVTLGGDLSISANNSYIVTGTLSSGNVQLNVQDLFLTGGADPNSRMTLSAATGGGTGNMDITARNITIQGSSATGTSTDFTGIQVGKSTLDTQFGAGSGGDGKITITASGDITLNGGSVNTASAYIGTFGTMNTNDVTINCANLNINGSAAGVSGSGASVFAGEAGGTGGGCLTINASNDIALTGTPNNVGQIFVNTSNGINLLSYDIQSIAGKNFSMDAGPSTNVQTLGTKDLTIVVDNAPPNNTPPFIGSGTFQAAGTISTNGGFLNIFSSTPSNTTITGTLNGSAYAFPANTISPQWFSTFAGGGASPFTVYFKGNSPFVPPTPPPNTLPQIYSSSAFITKFTPANTQGFYDFNIMFSYNQFDFISFQVHYNPAYGIEDKTYRSAREEYRNYNTLLLEQL